MCFWVSTVQELDLELQRIERKIEGHYPKIIFMIVMLKVPSNQLKEKIKI